MLEPTIQPDLYIFAAMDRNVGYAKLKDMANDLPHIAQVKETGQSLWLLRESNTQRGMLTVDIIRWDTNNNRWRENSTRMALHIDNGWIDASDTKLPEVKEAMKSMHQVNARSAGQHQDSLMKYLGDLPTFKLLVENRLNPSKSQQAKSSIYSQYTSTANIGRSAENENSKKTATSVLLTPDIIQAISCEISGKVLQKPMVLKADMARPNPNGHTMHLNRGKSYELAELQRLGISANFYCPNFVLAKIISRLGCNNIGLIENLESDRLIDPVMLEILDDPYILPSGHSLSKTTIDGMIASNRSLKCPQTQQPFTKENIVSNINLARFIRAWPESKALLIKSISTEPVTNTSNTSKPKL